MNVNNFNTNPVNFNYQFNPSTTLDELITGNASVDQIELFCQQFPSLINTIQKEDPPLLLAIKNNREDVALVLAKMGADVHFRDSNNSTILMHASELRMVELVQFLIKKGIDVNAVNNNGHYTALHFAVTSNDLKIFELLLLEGANIEAITEKGNTLLHMAAAHGNIEIVQLLLKHKAKITANIEGSTPLHAACIGNHDKIAQLLIEARADIEAKDKNDRTPLHYATRNGSFETIICLLTNNANINAKDKFQVSPLYIACENKQLKIAELLINKGADIHAKEKDDITLLHYVSQNGDLEIVKLLINNNADINARNKDLRTPLYYACMKSQFKVAELLLSKGADIEAKDKIGATPLTVAAANDSLEIVELLLNNNANIEAKMNKQTTPLWAAFFYNKLAIAEKLLEAGANPFVQAGNKTLFFEFIQKKNDDIFNLFLKKQSHDLINLEQSINSSSNELKIFKVFARQCDFLRELSSYPEYREKFLQGTEDCYYLLSSKKFNQYLKNNIERLKNLAESFDPSFDSAYKDLFFGLSSIQSLINLEPKFFSQHFCNTIDLFVDEVKKINEEIKKIKNAREAEKLKNLEEAEKIFGEEEIFEALSHFQLGIPGEIKGEYYLANESYKVHLNLENSLSLYDLGLSEGKDLQSIGINMVIENLINSLPENASTEQKLETWQRLLDALAQKKEFLLDIARIPSLHKYLLKKVKVIEHISKNLTILMDKASANEETSELEKSLYDQSKKINKKLNLKLLKHFLYQNNGKKIIKILDKNILQSLEIKNIIYSLSNNSNMVERNIFSNNLLYALVQKKEFLNQELLPLMPNLQSNIEELVNIFSDLFTLLRKPFTDLKERKNEENYYYDLITIFNSRLNSELEKHFLSSAVKALLQDNNCDSLSALQEKDPERFNAAALYEAHKLISSKKRGIEGVVTDLEDGRQ